MAIKIVEYEFIKKENIRIIFFPSQKNYLEIRFWSKRFSFLCGLLKNHCHYSFSYILSSSAVNTA